MAPEGNQEIFHGAINPIINDGLFAVVGRDMHFHSRNSKHYAMNILIANVAQGAFHNAAERSDPPRCLPGTRTTIREEIMAWIKSPKAHLTFILWLSGPAGAGKTAIAQTIAEECEKKGFLAASFFFSRMAAGRNDASRFVATLAYQLLISIPQIRDPMLAAIEKDPVIFSRTLAVQMRTLVAAPLAAASKAIHLGPQVVVVDGIDESGPNGKAQAELLKVVGDAISELREIPITFFIGSRPEYDIRLAFSMKALGPLVKVLVLNDKYNPDADIRCYFESQFQEIRERQLALGIPLTAPWPKKFEVERLVQKSSGQFIFASTVIKFVDSLRDPAKGLDIVLGLSAPGKETPFAQLDALYSFILSSVDNLPKVLEVLTLLMLADHYSDRLRVDTVDELLRFEVRRVLLDMHALVFVPPPTSPEAALRIHHASLYDFLTDRSRSQEFFVDAKQGHIMIGQCWLRMIANYFHSKHSQGSESLQIVWRVLISRHFWTKLAMPKICMAQNGMSF
ncbi:hypothetical protein BJ912DRAFT_662986 [Pholiota molesta]|nr:hypothetical protein BJ912DRAFT_662986 [Pholiota molesta]